MAAYAKRLVGVLSSGSLAVTLGVVSFASPAHAAADAETNSAFVFIKPHANTAAAQALVKKTLAAKGIAIKAEGELTGETIDRKMLIDQHYYAIASKATLLQPKDMPVPADKFEAGFGLSYKQALADGVVYNALDGCKYLGVDATELDKLWATAKKVKLGGGFYCGLIAVPGKKPVYIFNGFFMKCVRHAARNVRNDPNGPNPTRVPRP